MAGSLGTVFVELDLDKNKFEASQRRLLEDVKKVSLDVEKNMKTLGTHSASSFDLMRQRVQNAFDSIKHSAKATSDDIVRAEKAKNAQLKALQEQQYGVQVGMMQKLKSNWIAVTAAVTAAYFAMQKAWNVSEQAAQYEQSRMAFKSMVQGMGKDAETEFQKIKKASAGLVDNKSLVESANKAMSLGISIDSLAGLMEISRVKARDMGTATADAFNDIAIGIGRASPKILDNLGIIIKIGTANEAVAASLGKTVEQLTDKEKQLAVTNAVLDAGKEALARYNLEQKTTKEKMDSLRATVTNLNLLLGQAFIRAAGGAVGAFQTIEAASVLVSAGIWKTIAAYQNFMGVVTFGDTSKAHYEAAAYAKEQAEADMTAAGKYWKSAKDNFAAMTATTDELAGAMKKLPAIAADAGEAVADSAAEMKEAIKGAQEDFDLYLKLTKDLEAQEKAAIEAGKKDFDLYLAGLHAADQIEKERIKNIEKSRKEAEKNLDELEQYWKHTFENIHDATADAFYQIFSNIEDGFQALFDNIKTWFLKLLAEMAATAIARPIILPIVTGVASALGMSGTASASGGGGLFDFSGLSSLASIGSSSAGWGVAGGIIESGNFLEWSDTAINWANVAGYIGLAYNAYSFFQSIGDQKWMSATGTALGTAVGAVVGGGPVGAAIGASVGNLVGGILDSVFGLGESAPEFTLSEHNARYGKEQAKWTEGKGIGTGYWPEFESDWDIQPTVEYTAIAKAYAKGRKEIAENFNDSMTTFMEALPSEYLTVVEEALTGMDFTWSAPDYRYEFANAQEVIENLLLNYADFLAGKFDEIVNVVSAAYYEQEISTSDLYGKLTTGKQGQVSDLLTGGSMTGEEFQTFLSDWNTLLGVMASFEEFVNPSAAALSAFEQVTKNVGDQFDAYIDTLERAGVEVSKLGDLEQMRADTIAREISALQDSFWTEFIDSMTLAYSGMTDYEKKVYQVTKQFDEYIAQAVDLGMSEERIAEIREWERIALEGLVEVAEEVVVAIEEVTYSLEQMQQLSNAMSLMSGGTGDARMEQISNRYNWQNYGTKYLPNTGGYNWANITNEILSMHMSLADAEYIARAAGITLDQLLEDFDYIADTFTAMKQAAATTAASLEQGYMQATLSPEDFKKWQAEKTYSETTTQIRDWYRQGIIDYSEFTTMRSHALAIYEAEIEGIGDTFQGLIDKARNAWESLADSISKSIYSLTTSSDNQADAVERLGIAAQAIRDYTGGMSTENYVASLSTDEDRRNAIEEMMSLYGGYLNVAQEAYQRPSSEYQAIYQEVLNAYQQMETMAEGYRTDFDIQTDQLEVLRQIAINTGLYGSYDTGTDYVPRTGPYLLHEGERVTPKGENGGGDVYFSLTINGSNMNPREARQEFEVFLRSGIGRKLIQKAAAGQ